LPRTFAYWCRHRDADDLASLHNKREQEHYRKATWEYIQLLLETIDKEPQELGYEFCRWMGERLATYLASKTGFQSVIKFYLYCEKTDSWERLHIFISSKKKLRQPLFWESGKHSFEGYVGREVFPSII